VQEAMLWSRNHHTETGLKQGQHEVVSAALSFWQRTK